MRRIFIPALILVFLILGFLLSCSTPPREPIPGKEDNLSSSSKAPTKEEDKTASIAPAKEGDKKAEKVNEYVGAETCQACHGPVYDRLAKTAMGTLFLKHPRTAAEKLGCETCHGPGTVHVEFRGQIIRGYASLYEGDPNAGFRAQRCLSQVPSKEGEAFLVGQCS